MPHAIPGLPPGSARRQHAQVLSVHPSLPAKSYAELVALAKAEPGKLNFSTAGVGGPPADLAAHQATDSAKWGKIIKEQGIKFE